MADDGKKKAASFKRKFGRNAPTDEGESVPKAKKEIRFNRPHAGYNAGESAWFDPHIAGAMCSGENPPAYDPHAGAPAEPPVKAKAKSPKKKKAPKKK